MLGHSTVCNCICSSYEHDSVQNESGVQRSLAPIFMGTPLAFATGPVAMTATIHILQTKLAFTAGRWTAYRAKRIGAQVPLLAIAVTLASPAMAAAQAGGEGFLFRAPNVTVAVRGGYTIARASGGIFEFITDSLTLSRGDFDGITFSADVGVRANDHVDIVLGVGYSRTGGRSQFREWFDQDERPIEQDTRLTRLPVTVSGRYYLQPRGQSIGRFAWIPTRVAPYVGAGAGLMYYRFQQEGDFVDYVDLDVFSAELSSSGWTATGHAFGGVEIALGMRTAFTAEARYIWASTELGYDFSGYSINLAGFQPVVGLAFRF